MTADEVEKYIAQLAFSGAADFVDKMKEQGMDNKNDICNQVKRTLITTLQMNNLEALAIKAEKINFHIHDLEFGQILLMKENRKIWICNHSPQCDENTEENTKSDN